MKQIYNQILVSKIAKRVKTLRESRGITQEVFYFDTNIHIARIETAKANISVSTLDAICTYLDISLGDFFTGLSD